MSTGWIVLGVIVIIVLFAFAAYNRLVALSQRVGQAFADIAELRALMTSSSVPRSWLA